jgi:hypothetical protein
MLSAVRSFVGQDGIATPSMACVGSNKVLAPAHCLLRGPGGRADRVRFDLSANGTQQGRPSLPATF